jgi:dethiobiotin synthetase
MKRAYFMTGTDTNVGKTWVTLALMANFKAQNLSVLGMKPVASGCEKVEGEWKNDDALAIQENGSQFIDYNIINPFAYELPLSPHLAGKKNPVNFDVILENFKILQNVADVVIVEGAGGWYAPLTEQKTISDLAQKLNLPIILVVGIKLGCISHALLTAEAIKNAGLNCIGWVAVCNDVNFSGIDLTIESVQKRLLVPLLSIFRYQQRTSVINFPNVEIAKL